MKLGLIPFVSQLHDKGRIEKDHSDLFEKLKSRFSLSFVSPDNIHEADQTVAFIASGGVEDDFRAMYPRLPRPLLLLADGKNNSLAASMEILAWIKERGDSSEILHGDLNVIVSRLERLCQIIQTRKKIAGAVIGILGAPSPWLIASYVDPIAAARRWGITFDYIEVGDLQKFKAEISDDQATDLARSFISRARAIKEPDESKIIEASRLYLAIKRLSEERKLDAITVRCFDFLKDGTTGCLALSLLNDDGLTAGCEGDAQSTFSMFLLRILTGEIPFMANPAAVECETNRISLAHCTVATSITREFVLRNHFESGLGVAIQGEFSPGPVTVFKCGRPGLDRFFISGGRLLSNQSDPNRCRTQVELVLDERVEYFLKNPLANHHLMVRGNHAGLLKEFVAAAETTPNMF
ncbi:MAG: fucose isomerase [Candidatus Riflebacteria bacterium]|nr:fucose isomerase [Candidatus Riflebacteria bacterium]